MSPRMRDEKETISFWESQKRSSKTKMIEDKVIKHQERRSSIISANKEVIERRNSRNSLTDIKLINKRESITTTDNKNDENQT